MMDSEKKTTQASKPKNHRAPMTDMPANLCNWRSLLSVLKKLADNNIGPMAQGSDAKTPSPSTPPLSPAPRKR